MSELALVDSDRFQLMEEVAKLRYQGLSDTAVAKQLNIKRVVAIELYNEYKDLIQKDSEARDIARDYLNTMVQHYDILIKKFYDLLDELDAEDFNAAIAAQKNSALKQIADLEAKRLSALREAGLLEGRELGEEIARLEEEKDIVIDILRNDLCVRCKPEVMRKLAKVTGQTEVVVVYDDSGN